VNGTFDKKWLYRDALRPVAEVDSAGVFTHFVYADSQSGAPDFLIRSGVLYRVVKDYLGSVRMVINASTGAIAQSLEYDAFGRVLNETGSGFQPFGFAGGLYDADTKLVRFGARDYDPDMGRWTNKDPIGFAGGDTNIYAYVGNDPVNWVDLSGLVPWVEVLLPPAAVFDLANVTGAFATVANLVTPGASTSLAWNNGNPVIVLEDSWLSFGNGGLTLGHVVALKRTRKAQPNTYKHELAHVKQHDVLGPAYLQSHIIAQTWSRLTSGEYEVNNPLEKGPYCDVPKPWWW
jgi:RHS repeat-associated protein